MSRNNFFICLCFILFAGLLQAQKSLHSNPADIQTTPDQINIDFNSQIIQDPFLKKTSPQQGKKHHSRTNKGQFPQGPQSQQVWNTYKPFDYDNQNKEEEHQSKRQNTKEFNQLLKWGMLGGSVFLIYVLVNTCTKKRGRRQIRRIMQETQRRRQNLPQPLPHAYFYQPQPQQTFNMNQRQPQEQEVLDEKILHAQKQLNRLKQLKQQALIQQFNRKKIEEEQRRVQMINLQRNQNSQPRQNNWNVGYGPIFHGQQKIVYSQGQVQQPFQVQGIEPIRKRSNSFKTEISEQPILNNQIKYRNGIPVGKPIRQHDNDSSFASEYPQV